MNFLELYAKRSLMVDWYHQKDAWFTPNTEWDDLDFKVMKLPEKYSFDLAKLLDEVKSITDQYSFVHRDELYRNTTYSGISLTSRDLTDNPLDDWWVRVQQDGTHMSDHSKQLFDGNIALSYETAYKTETTAMSSYISEIVSKFNSSVTRVALMQLQGEGAITPHVDFPYYHCIRLHACLSGSEHTILEIEKEQFRIPEDGNFYFIDTGKTHGVINTSQNNRINLNVNLLVPIDLLRTYGLRQIIERGML